jgi:pyridoxal phosphate enzyme (YggS family)
MDFCETAYGSVRARIEVAARAAGSERVCLLAVSKGQSADAVRALAGLGQRAFGENYVQEALAKQDAVADPTLEWHLIGPLQSNKCRDAALRFDWVQSLDRGKLVEPLARHRPRARAALNVLVQVNVDGEPGKAGCTPGEVDALAELVARQPALRLRGLMAIPTPWPAVGERCSAFRRMRELFDRLGAAHPGVDTLSMGMSDDFELAIAEGATMVRVGTALFGARPSR